MLQLQQRHTPTPTEAAYLEVAERKTASLFVWCCRAPVHLTDNPALLEAMTTFGRSLGLCFQMVDDILDLEADEAMLGKQLLVDLAGGKATLPVILGMERDPSLRQAWLRLAEQQMANEEASEAAFAFAQAVRASGGIEAARERARAEAALARSALLTLPHSEARAHLLSMADGLVARIR
jgi:octaprenyl-diphosphate synthase